MTYKIHQYILYDQYAQKLLLMNDAYLNKKKNTQKSKQIQSDKIVPICKNFPLHWRKQVYT